MFSYKILFILIICNLLDSYLQYKNHFCESRHANNMIEVVFNTGTAVYAIRKPFVYPMIKPGDKWIQKQEAIPYNYFFIGVELKRFESGFSIITFNHSFCNGCESKTSLKDESFNITYILSGNKFYIFRELENGSFRIAQKKDMAIPFKKEEGNPFGSNSGFIGKLFQLKSPIYASFFQWRVHEIFEIKEFPKFSVKYADPIQGLGFLLTDEYKVHVINIPDVSKDVSNNDNPSSKGYTRNFNPITFRGAFTLLNSATYFVYGNQILFNLPQKQDQLIIRTDIWDFFDCQDSDEVFETSMISISDHIQSHYTTQDVNEEEEDEPFIDLSTVFIIICFGITFLILIAFVINDRLKDKKSSSKSRSEKQKLLGVYDQNDDN